MTVRLGIRAGPTADRRSTKLRVLLIPQYGGNPYTHLLVSALEERGVDVRRSAVSGWLSLFRAMRAQGKPDLVHLQWQHRFFLKEDEGPLAAGLRTALFFVQWLVLRLAGVRFVWTVHNLVNHERQLVKLELAACCLLARIVDRIVVHCAAAADRVSETYRVPRDRLWVVPHGHYIGFYPAPPERNRAREALGLPARGRVLLNFGQIRPYKGVEDLIVAFTRTEGDEICLVVAGKPRYEWLDERIRDLAAGDSRIRLDFRFLPEGDLTSYLSAADAVVLPYTDSLTSGSAILAGSLGRAVIAPDVGCLGAFPEDAVVRYAPEDPNALGAALQKACHAPLGEMGRAARAFVERFSWSEVALATSAVYESLPIQSADRG